MGLNLVQTDDIKPLITKLRDAAYYERRGEGGLFEIEEVADELQHLVNHRDRSPAKTNALELAITLAKVERLCHDVLVDNHDPVGDEARNLLTTIQRIINHRDLDEAKALLQFRKKIRDLATSYEGTSRARLGDDLYMELIEALNER